MINHRANMEHYRERMKIQEEELAARDALQRGKIKKKRVRVSRKDDNDVQ